MADGSQDMQVTNARVIEEFRADHPFFTDHQARTQRQIPLVVLERS